MKLMKISMRLFTKKIVILLCLLIFVNLSVSAFNDPRLMASPLHCKQGSQGIRQLTINIQKCASFQISSFSRQNLKHSRQNFKNSRQKFKCSRQFYENGIHYSNNCCCIKFIDSGILRDKTLDDILIQMPNDDKQNKRWDKEI